MTEVQIQSRNKGNNVEIKSDSGENSPKIKNAQNEGNYDDDVDFQ